MARFFQPGDKVRRKAEFADEYGPCEGVVDRSNGLDTYVTTATRPDGVQRHTHTLELVEEPVFGGTLKIGPVYDATHYGLDETFCENVAAVFDTQRQVLLSKHKDYSGANIAQSPGGPLNGLRVRMWDKLARINHLVESGAEPENESLVDSFADLANYAIIGVLVLRGEWPGVE